MHRPIASVRALTVAAGCCLAVTTGSLACGYHGSLGEGFSASHPRSIEVAVAVRRALDDGVLPNSNTPPFLAFAHAKATLERVRAVLAPGLHDTKAPKAIAVLLVEGSLWTRYYVDTDRLVCEPHVSGPLAGDAIIVTAEAVLQALLSGRLSIDQAIGQELIAAVDAPNSFQSTVAVLRGAFPELTR
jgi:hypothetical protein